MEILEALQNFVTRFQGNLVVETDSTNAIPWVSSSADCVALWRFHFYFNEIRLLSLSIEVEFNYVVRLANAMVDSLANQGIDRSSPMFVLSL